MKKIFQKIKTFLKSDYVVFLPLLNLFVLIVAMIFSYYCGYNEGKNNDKTLSNNNTVYADELNYDYVYSTSNLYFLGNAFRVDLLYPSNEGYIHDYFKNDLTAYGGDVHRYLATTLSFDLKYSTLNNNVALTLNKDRIGIFSRKQYEYYDARFYNTRAIYALYLYADTITTYNPDTYDYFNSIHRTHSIGVSQYDGGDYVYGAFQIAFFMTGVPDISKLVSVDIFTRYQYVAPSGSTPEYYKVCNVLQYTDINGVRIVILLYNPFYSSSGNVVTVDDLPIFEDRTYYFPPAFNSSTIDQVLLDEAYSNGERNGILKGSNLSQDTLNEYYNNGIRDANNTVNVNSASYNAGHSAGLAEGSNESYILSPVNAINSIFNIVLFRVGEFEFKLNYLVYIAFGGLLVSLISRFVFHG